MLEGTPALPRLTGTLLAVSATWTQLVCLSASIPFLVAVTKYETRSNLRKGGFVSARSLMGKSILIGKGMVAEA